MSNFFLLTHEAIVGPMTGVELREAALAGILHHKCVVGGARGGPWHLSSEIGLFSDQGVPLPHPPGVQVPMYQVKGKAGATQGPFKLRELIGMAARGMLPPDAELREIGSQQWSSVQCVPVLIQCFEGQLVRVNDRGDICQRTAGVLEGTDPLVGKPGIYYAPVDLPKKISLTELTTVENSHRGVPRLWAQAPSEPPPRGSDAAEKPIDVDQTRATRWWARPRRSRESRWPVLWPGRLHRRVAAFAVSTLILVPICVWAAMFAFQPGRTEQTDVIGDWIVWNEGTSEPIVGIRFDAQGECVLFNPRGTSWSGNYVWSERESEWSEALDLPGMHSVIDRLEPGHVSGPVRPTDGYVLLQGIGKEVPEIDGHPIQDLFLRREGGELKVGYLTEVTWNATGKRMTAGWVAARRSAPPSPGDVEASLHRTSRSEPDPTDSDLPRFFEAIDALRTATGAVDPLQSQERGSRVMSNRIDGTYLLKEFGVPDQARRMYGFETPKLPRGTDFGGDQMVRYGSLVLLLSDVGKIEYVRIENPGAAGMLARTRPGP
jgi:hypothetical protein